jgi:hypothetical protein
MDEKDTLEGEIAVLRKHLQDGIALVKRVRLVGPVTKNQAQWFADASAWLERVSRIASH